MKQQIVWNSASCSAGWTPADTSDAALFGCVHVFVHVGSHHTSGPGVACGEVDDLVVLGPQHCLLLVAVLSGGKHSKLKTRTCAECHRNCVRLGLGSIEAAGIIKLCNLFRLACRRISLCTSAEYLIYEMVSVEWRPSDLMLGNWHQSLFKSWRNDLPLVAALETARCDVGIRYSVPGQNRLCFFSVCSCPVRVSLCPLQPQIPVLCWQQPTRFLKFEALCIRSCFSAHCSCKEWLSELSQPSCQPRRVRQFSFDVANQPGVFVHRATIHWVFFFVFVASEI